MMSQSVEVLRQQRPQKDDVPVLLSVVANQSMHLSERAWKELLYGLSHEKHGSTILDTRHFGGWFQDPFRTFVGGVLCANRHSNPPAMSLVLTPSCFPILGASFTPSNLPYPYRLTNTLRYKQQKKVTLLKSQLGSTEKRNVDSMRSVEISAKKRYTLEY